MAAKIFSDWFSSNRNDGKTYQQLNYLFHVSRYPYIHTKTLIKCTDPGVVNSNRNLIPEKVAQAILTHVVYQLHLPKHIHANRKGREVNFKPDLIRSVKEVINGNFPNSIEFLRILDHFLLSLFAVGIVDLFIAIRKPNLAIQALEAGASAEHMILQRFSLLHLATLFGNKKLIEYLLEKTNLSLTQTDCLGNTPLHYAGFVHHPGMEKLLIKLAEKQGISASSYRAIQNKLCATVDHYSYQKNHRAYFEPYLWIKENNELKQLNYQHYLDQFKAGILRYSIPNPQFLIDLILFIQPDSFSNFAALSTTIPGVDHVYIAKTETMGWGLFAKENLQEGAAIGYAGEICNFFDLEAKNINRRRTNPYCINFDERYIIDGESNGGIGRFANCEATYPNTMPISNFVNGLPIVVLIARRPIFKDEEIKWDYGASRESVIRPDQSYSEATLDRLWGKETASIIKRLNETPPHFDELIQFLTDTLNAIKT